MLGFVRALVLFAALCGALSGLADPVSADEGKARKEVWVYGRDGERRELDVTHMTAELRGALDVQLRAKGWKRLPADLAFDGEDLPSGAVKKDEPRKDEPKKNPKALDASTKRDIEELVRGGGILPEGFRPTAMGERRTAPEDASMAALARAAGRVILRYLEVKDDPVKGPVYEKVLGDVGTLLVALDGSKPAGARQIGMRMLGLVMRGMNDPATAPVYREIVDLVTKEMAEGMSPPAAPRARGGPEPTAPPAGPPLARALPRRLFVGGAALRVEPAVASDPSTRALVVLGVEPGSMAQEMGLRGGDVIRSVNGRRVDGNAVAEIRKALGKRGKLSIEVKRRDGKIEVLDIEFEAAEPAGGAGSE